MNKKYRKNLILLLIAESVLLVFFGVFLYLSERNVSLEQQGLEVEQKLNRIADALEAETESADFNDAIAADQQERILEAFIYMSDAYEDIKINDVWMDSRVQILGVEHCAVVKSTGRVVASSYGSVLGENEYRQLVEASKASLDHIGHLYFEDLGYYVKAGTDGNYYVIAVSVDDPEVQRKARYASNRILAQIPTENNLFMVVQDGIVRYHANEEYIGKQIQELNLDPMITEGNSVTWAEMDGSFYTGMKHIESLDIDLYYGIRKENMMNANLTIALIMGFLILCLFGMTVYAYFARSKRRHEKPDPDSVYSSKNVMHRILALSIIFVLLLSSAAYYLQSLFALTMYTMDDREDLTAAKAVISSGMAGREEIREQYDQMFLQRAKIISGILSEQTQLRTKEELRKLSRIFDVEYIMMFNTNGEEILSDSSYSGFVISRTEGDQSYEFLKMLNGVPYLIQEAQNDELTGEFHQFIAIQTTDKEGNNDGFLQIAIVPEQLLNALESGSLETILDQVVTMGDERYFAIDRNTGLFTYAPNTLLIKEAAEQYGFSGTMEEDTFFDSVNVDGTAYFLSGEAMDDQYVFVGSEEAVIYRGRRRFVLSIALFSALFFGILALRLRDVERREEMEQRGTFIDQTKPLEETVPVETDSLIRKRWDSYLPERRTFEVVRGLALLMIIAFILFLLNDPQQKQIVDFLVSNRWEKGLNIFAVTGVIGIWVAALTGLSLFGHLVRGGLPLLNARHQTVLMMIKNTVVYVTVIVVIFWSLYFLGIPRNTLLVSGGILLLIVGLGSKDLVSDILAGLFIIFEGEFQVGDVVEIEGYRGTVKEIGLRTTKLIGSGQNTKIISNRNVTNVINMTEENSYVSVTATVGYSVSIDALEDIFQRELQPLKDKYKEFETAPFFYGVNSLGNSGMTFIVRAECSEKDIEHMEVVLTKEVKSILDRYDIRMR